MPGYALTGERLVGGRRESSLLLFERRCSDLRIFSTVWRMLAQKSNQQTPKKKTG
jgi:hypothetical protein